ncbi:MAG TPA: erythromycin esterase family protein, partial [Polyangiaceae bacterium]|nr:erythromycin esterase family protein [Polyangiaceae bacterium]
GLGVRLSSPSFELHGTVEGLVPSAAPATVRFLTMSEAVGAIFFAECDAQGHFAAKLPAGRYVAAIETEAAEGSVEGIELERDTAVRVVTHPRNPSERPPPEAVVAWAKQNAIALSTLEPNSGFDDLEALRPLIGAARLVALGEATHGTREFRALRQRLLAFLVERMGFRAAIIEESFAETLADDAYVRSSGEEEPGRDTLVGWLRRYNHGKAEADKIRYLGNDLRRPARGVSVLAKVLPRIDPALWRQVEKDLEPLADDWSTFIDVHFFAPPSPREEGIAAAAERVAKRLDERRDADVKALGAETWAVARIYAHVLADFARLMMGGDFEARDRSMADNTVRLLDLIGPGAKGVLFAHNAHVQKVATPMGHQGLLLHERLGNEYVVIGTAFDRGAFNARLRRSFGIARLGPAPPGSLDGMLARVGLPRQLPEAELVNGDFESGRVGESPVGWRLESVPGQLHYRARLERGAASRGLALVLDRELDPTPVGYGSLTQRIDATPLRGARVRVSAQIQLESHALGDKAFVFVMPETGSTLPYASSEQAVASGVWRETAVERDVPAGASALQLGVIVTGAARARVDDVRVLPVAAASP